MASRHAAAAEPGHLVADVAFTTTDGTTLSIGQEAATHRALVFIFLSTSCPFSNFFNERLRTMPAAYADRRVGFVGVFPNRSESADEVRAQVRRQRFAFPVARDRDLELTRLFGAVSTPEVFVLDADRKLRYRGQLESKVGSPDLANALEALLAGREIKVRVTKAFGCAIEGR